LLEVSERPDLLISLFRRQHFIPAERHPADAGIERDQSLAGLRLFGFSLVGHFSLKARITVKGKA
jgi:hypothetical protein